LKFDILRSIFILTVKINAYVSPVKCFLVVKLIWQKGGKMDPVALDPGDYDGTYKLIGGEISLDFVNTVSWPDTDREHDWLDRPGNVTAWAVAAGIINEGNRDILDRRPHALLKKELKNVHHIRKNLEDVLRPLAFNEPPVQTAIETLTTLIHQVYALRRLDPVNYLWKWENLSSLTRVIAPVIWNAAHVLTSIDHTRISHCPSCNWIFYDNTRNRSRRWCDMVDCGSRDKALRYYHRAKATNSTLGSKKR
jgi:predicted RNA-binding Zn ribbon-like protein